MLAAEASRLAGEDVDQAAHFRLIEERIRSITDELDAMVWAIDPRHDTLRSLVGYLGDFVSQFAAASSLRCRLDLPTDLPELSLPSDVRHHLFLAVRESVHNAARHAQAAEIALTLRCAAGRLELTIRDDGAGFDPGGVTPGHGMANLRVRLASLGGTCTLESRPGSGTWVHLHCPLPQPPAA